MCVLPDNEIVIRLLFSDRMVVENGRLTSEAFPVDELMESNGKSVSIDRCHLMNPDWIQSKLITYEKPEKGRARWGASYSAVSNVLDIQDEAKRSVFCVCADEIIDNFPPNPWDHAHAKIVSAQPEKGKGFIRGFRDKLIDAFSLDIRKI